MDAFLNAEGLLALATLTFLEVILGVDNVIFISILSGKLPENKQLRARRTGLLAAMLMRIGLLVSIAWIIRLTAPLFTVFGRGISGRDLILISGGLFLLGKATVEIRSAGRRGGPGSSRAASFAPSSQIIAARYRLLARLRDHRRRHGGRCPHHGRRSDSRRGHHDVSAEPISRSSTASDGQGACRSCC
jgi:hypothetical protein